MCITGRGGGEALACIRPGLSKEKEALTSRMRPKVEKDIEILPKEGQALGSGRYYKSLLCPMRPNPPLDRVEEEKEEEKEEEEARLSARIRPPLDSRKGSRRLYLSKPMRPLG